MTLVTWVVGLCRSLSRQTKVLAVMGVADLLLTLWLIQAQDAWEANPLMALALRHGLGTFVAAKLAMLLGPLALLEWARRKSPAFVRRAANAAILGYLVVYAVGIGQANLGQPMITELAFTPADARLLALSRSRSPRRASSRSLAPPSTLTVARSPRPVAVVN